MEERIDRIENRLTKIEEWRSREETRAAVAVEQAKHIDRELGEIKGAFWKATWIVLGAVLLAATTFVLRGGLVGG